MIRIAVIADPHVHDCAWIPEGSGLPGAIRHLDQPPAMATPSASDPDPFPFISSPWCASVAPDHATVKVDACYPAASPAAVHWPSWWAGSYNRNLNDPDRPAGVELDTWAATLRYQPDSSDPAHPAMYLMFDGDPRCWKITQPDSATMPLQHAITEYAHAPLPSLCPE